MRYHYLYRLFFFFQAEDGIRDYKVTGVQTCALPISDRRVLRIGHIHKRPNFFFDSLMLTILYDADDLDVQWTAARAEFHMAADGITAGEKHLGHRFIDDDHFGALCCVPLREFTSR